MVAAITPTIIIFYYHHYYCYLYLLFATIVQIFPPTTPNINPLVLSETLANVTLKLRSSCC